MKKLYYKTDDGFFPASKQMIQELARNYVLEKSLPKNVLDSPNVTKNWLINKLSAIDYEIFGMILLNNRHTLISYEELFKGTIDGSSVHPREVVKKCLELSASAVIFTHNHPSGHADFSHADIMITKRLKDALGFVDIRVLDHMVVANDKIISMAERGEL